MKNNTEFGNSPFAVDMYKKYLDFWADANAKINAIDKLPSKQRNLPNVVQDRKTILAAQTALYTVYRKDAAESTDTLQTYLTDTKADEGKIQSAYNDAMGKIGPIEKDYRQAESIIRSAASTITEDLNNLDLQALQSQISILNTEVSKLPSGKKKLKAQKDLGVLKKSFSTLKSLVNQTQGALAAVLALQTQANGALSELEALSKKIHPTQNDIAKASQLLGKIQFFNKSLETFQTNDMAQVNQARSNTFVAMNKVESDVRNSPSSGKVQHACWYVDWASHTFPVPEGVNMVNLFVGEVKYVNGKYQAVGFGAMSNSDISEFVKKCNDKKIAVKISLGGGGGSYDNFWDIITKENVSQIASDLAAQCASLGLAGIDFDYEELGTDERDALVGNLILNFKKAAPKLEASFCTNAGFGPNFPWQARAKRVLDAASESGKCLVDRFYIMSYYESMQKEIDFVEGWASWLEQEYGFAASQITVGIDNTDAHAYNVADFATWAGKKGYSTGYWMFNPATPERSNESTNTILNSYNSSKLKYKILRVFKWALYYLLPLFFKKPEPINGPRKLPFSPLPSNPIRKAYGHSPLPSAPPTDDFHTFMETKGDSVYIDMGKLYGTYVLGNDMVWWPDPVHIDQDKLDVFLDTFFSKLQENKTKTLNLSFAQIEDIAQLLAGKSGAADDTITQIFDKNYPVGNTGENFLKYFVMKAKENGIKSDISFGGAVATSPNMKIPGDATAAAKTLAAFMDEYGIDSVDFDLEGSAAAAIVSQNGSKKMNAFFSTLHSELSQKGKNVILTPMGALQEGPEGILKTLFQNLDVKFDGVNLMLYSNSQYYLDASNPTWGISEWEKYVPANKLNVGFYDSIDYTNPDSSAGKKYDIPSELTNGQAAAFIYLQLQSDLKKLGKDANLGEPFFWTDNPQNIAQNSFMIDFEEYLLSNGVGKYLLKN